MRVTHKKRGKNKVEMLSSAFKVTLSNQKKKEKKAYRGNSTGTDNQRASESLIVPLPVLVVLVMVP